ncbi:hypothetical protein TGDOM2_265290 [Toxoplasma gondii GAB2-2007-GAL-DOM2]|uniref:Uncharacterized protein n=5 Tax=Toxoplasma gondii TaxID=5811 RepID=S7UGW8_TOXGG|nr:hypothetical protein TGGT1_265290 [Toxoplasma gondii GT1]KAF4644225.1 hypothetical protein TGRH88_012170 [Toxoplasma gondii]KFG38564.1 hypothetical protein TGDOM2_265290 [Toxoplasma gondii GAB2-2007-GAL-DOM2]KFG42134.1 hypothetical protein TGFOU_265290 [Toxoplasma gondii FOU]RQX74015.1 hypothetical protein TGCAST_265290 [Toxoplasma gondii CAST]
MARNSITLSFKNVLARLFSQKGLPDPRKHPVCKVTDAVEENSSADVLETPQGPAEAHAPTQAHRQGYSLLIRTPTEPKFPALLVSETGEEHGCSDSEQSSSDTEVFVANQTVQSQQASRTEEKRQRIARLRLDPFLISFPMYPAVLTFSDCSESVDGTSCSSTAGPLSPSSAFTEQDDLPATSFASRLNEYASGNGDNRELVEMEKLFSDKDYERTYPCEDADAFSPQVSPLRGSDLLAHPVDVTTTAQMTYITHSAIFRRSIRRSCSENFITDATPHPKQDPDAGCQSKRYLSDPATDARTTTSGFLERNTRLSYRAMLQLPMKRKKRSPPATLNGPFLYDVDDMASCACGFQLASAFVRVQADNLQSSGS